MCHVKSYVAELQMQSIYGACVLIFITA